MGFWSMARLFILVKEWQGNFKRINQIIKDIKRSPFEGIGKPEALRNNLSGLWSRRINKEHRVVYLIEEDTIVIFQCKGHYK